MSVLLRDVEVDGQRLDVRVDRDVVAVARDMPVGPHDEVIEGGGGALLPGLHDHHLHLMALAAAATSVRCGPPVVTDEQGLRRALTAVPGTGWVRGIGYHESVAGELDRDVLDELLPGRPVRVQHRGGALWTLNSAALALLGLETERSTDVERDDTGRLTGRLWRWDDRLRALLPIEPPDLTAVGRALSALGITGVTDATPGLDADTCARLRASLPQRIQLLGLPEGSGPRKLLLRDHDLPTFDDLTAEVEAARRQGRAVAVHCVTRESLVLTTAVLQHVGPMTGDRIEHGAVVPAEIAESLAAWGVAVVTQPVFVSEKGDDYLRDVTPQDQPLLYPYASLLHAGVRVAPSSDAPFGSVDPWQGIAAATTRHTRAGVVLGEQERVPARVALDGYLSPLEDPGGPPRRIVVGAPGDLCLLHVSLSAALAEPSRGQNERSGSMACRWPSHRAGSSSHGLSQGA